MKIIELHIFSISLGWVMVFNLISYYIPLLNFAGTLTLIQFFMGMFFEYLKPKSRMALMGINFIVCLPASIQAFMLFQSNYNIIISLVGCNYWQFYTMIILSFSLIFFVQPFYYWKLLHKIKFYEIAESRLPLLSLFKVNKK